MNYNLRSRAAYKLRVRKSLKQCHQTINRKGVKNTKKKMDVGAHRQRKKLLPVIKKKQNGSKTGIDPSCSVCLDTCFLPVKLPCSHIFCYLCAKGLFFNSRNCAICRQDIPASFFDNPNLVSVPPSPPKVDKGCKWFYEGYSGWWLYDDVTNSAIEEAFQGSKDKIEVMISGFIYEINLKDRTQQRKIPFSRLRRIKRDRATADKKGIAGLVLPPPRKKMCRMVSRLL